MLPYLALALYIVSLITSLILMLTAKRKQAASPSPTFRWFKLAVIVHLLFLLLFFIGQAGSDESHAPLVLNLSFLFYFCTGTALCGWAMRTSIPLFAKIYFMLFDASVLLFLFMPFNFSLFLLSGNFTGSNEVKFPVNEQYYIMEQGHAPDHTGHPVYRVVKHRGMFNQTVQYNLNFGGTLDSIHVLSIINGKSASLRGYIKPSAEHGKVDSTDMDIKLKHETKDEIQRQI